MREKDIEKLFDHLADYKKTKLHIPENGTWNNLKKDYILPKEEEKKNLINSGFYTEEENEYNKIKTHTLFNHLNSSQALAINFTVPMKKKEKLSLLINNDKSKIIESWLEEKLDKNITFENEMKIQTSFDYLIETKNTYHFYEFKYSESSFGNAKNDDSHKKIYTNIYKPILDKICKEKISFDKFRKEYQLWRNICHVAYAEGKTGEVYFVLPDFRTDLINKVEEATKVLNDVYEKHVHKICIKKIVDELKESEDSDLKKHYKEFYEKYLNIDFEGEN